MKKIVFALSILLSLSIFADEMPPRNPSRNSDFSSKQSCIIEKRQAILEEIATAIGTFKSNYSQSDLKTNEKIIAVLWDKNSVAGQAIIQSCN
ncbi:MAG: hypothetical protein AB7I27_08115 [Bacteriovoracaceae bacterium]